MVHAVKATTIDTIDGDQGAGNCIEIHKNVDIDHELPDKSLGRVFVRVAI